MGVRRKARETLLQLLFQAELNNEKDPKELLKYFWKNFKTDPEISQWAGPRFLKILELKGELDQKIEKASEHWKVYRMSHIDRNILRTALFEFFYDEGTPAEIVMDEAIEVAKRFGSEGSGAFVNGILDKTWKEKSPAQ